MKSKIPLVIVLIITLIAILFPLVIEDIENDILVIIKLVEEKMAYANKTHCSNELGIEQTIVIGKKMV